MLKSSAVQAFPNPLLKSKSLVEAASIFPALIDKIEASCPPDYKTFEKYSCGLIPDFENITVGTKVPDVD